MPRSDGQKSAIVRRFFVSFCFFFQVSSPQAVTADATSCSTGKFHEQVTVNNVIDGDTVVLTDGRHVRLIGINTPEIGHENHKSELGAEQARDYLSRLLKTNKDLLLSYDDEHTDHYGRTLAHLFLHDGTNIQSLLLKRGLATTFTIPPNLDFLDCYLSSLEYARTHKIGLWALNQYQPRPAESISAKDMGYHIITGTVQRIGESKSSIWINLAKNVALRIMRDDLQYFDQNSIHSLAGKQIEARGRIYFYNGEFRIRLRHPIDLKIY